MRKQLFYRCPDSDTTYGGSATDTTTDETPLEETPVDEVPVEEETPVDETETEPVDEVPVEEETPVDETETEPVDEIPVEEETPVDETETEPVDETPVEEEKPVNESETEPVDQTSGEAPVEGTETIDETPLAPIAIDWKNGLSATSDENPAPEKLEMVASIKDNRTKIPEYITDKNKVKNGYMFDPFVGKAQPQPSSILPNTVEGWIWEELRSEGSYTSINTYDNMIVTWGRGIAGANIAKVLKDIFSNHPELETEFNNVGIGLDTNGILQVVDTNKNDIKTGSFALQVIKADKKLLDFLVDISLNETYKNIFLEAQWSFAKAFNPGFIAHANQSGWNKDAVQLMFHFSWWLPAYAWRSHTQEYKNTGGDPAKIIYLFAGYLNNNVTLVPYLKKFAGNAFVKYVAKEAYKTQPAAGDYLTFEDAGNKYYFPKT